MAVTWPGSLSDEPVGAGDSSARLVPSGEPLARYDAADSRGEGCEIVRDGNLGTLTKSKSVHRPR